jgi:hypothetical protein
LCSTNQNNGEKKEARKLHSSKKKKKKQFNRDLVGNKENEYPVPDSIKQ